MNYQCLNQRNFPRHYFWIVERMQHRVQQKSLSSYSNVVVICFASPMNGLFVLVGYCTQSPRGCLGVEHWNGILEYVGYLLPKT